MMKIVKNIRIALIIGFFYLLMILFLVIRIPGKELVLKGDLTPVTNGIEIDGATSQNGFYSIYVMSFEKPTLFQLFISHFNKNVTVNEVQKSQSFSLKEQYEMGQIDERISYQNAVISAYEKAHETNPSILIDKLLTGYIISYVDKKQPSLEIGDLIQSVNGLSIHDIDVNGFYNVFHENTSVSLDIIRDNKAITVIMNHVIGQTYFGVMLEPVYSIKTTPSYKELYADDVIGGPSGGLLQTLEIYTQLLNIDIKGLKVSGTGTITRDNGVGAIGGVKQKVLTANDHDIDLFFVPEANYKEALVTYNDLNNPGFDLVKVGDFDEAVEKLLSYIQNRP